MNILFTFLSFWSSESSRFKSSPWTSEVRAAALKLRNDPRKQNNMGTKKASELCFVKQRNSILIGNENLMLLTFKAGDSQQSVK